MPTRSEINRRFERNFDPRYNNWGGRTTDEVLKDAQVIGFEKDDFENKRQTYTRVHKVGDMLPDVYMRVRCSHIKSPNTWYASSPDYFYDPTDKTFRTRRGRNKTSKIYAWRQA